MYQTEMTHSHPIINPIYLFHYIILFLELVSKSMILHFELLNFIPILLFRIMGLRAGTGERSKCQKQQEATELSAFPKQGVCLIWECGVFEKNMVILYLAGNWRRWGLIL